MKKRTRLKKSLAMIVSFIMVFAMLPAAVFAAGGPHTVTFAAGANSVNNNVILTSVIDGTPINEIAPTFSPKPGYVFSGWSPSWSPTDVVENNMTFTALWTKNDPRNWDTALTHMPSVIFPPDAMLLDFKLDSLNDHTHLDYVYLHVDDEGNVSLIFFAFSNNKKFDDVKSFMSFAGFPGITMGFWNQDAKHMYCVFVVNISAGSVPLLSNPNGNSLNIINEGIRPHSIVNVALTFLNITYETQHIIFDDSVDPDPRVYTPWRVTPGTGIPGQRITAAPITIYGYVYVPGYTHTDGAMEIASGITTSGSKLILKLYYNKQMGLEWSINGISGGVARVLYNGEVQRLADLYSYDELFSITWPEGYDPSIEGYEFVPGPAATDPSGLRFIGPSGMDVGEYYQDLTPFPGYKIMYWGPQHDGTSIDNMEDITEMLGPPHIGTGMLEIVPYEITVWSGDATMPYSGTALEFNGASSVQGTHWDWYCSNDHTIWTTHAANCVAGVFPNSDELVVTVTGSRIPVGLSANEFVTSVRYYDADSDEYIDATYNYIIHEEFGDLTVTKRPITITAASDSKVFDGAALTNDGYSITAGSLAEGDTLSVTVTGTQTIVGSSPNVPGGAVIYGPNENDVTGNYEITYVNGTLTVTTSPPGPPPSLPPSDPPIIIKDPDPPKNPELDTINHFAYMIGYEDGTVRPKNNITRAEVSTIFFRLLTQESRTAIWSKTNSFSDVKPDAWYNNAISTLANGGILQGYPDGSFRPGATITRAELATIAVRFHFNGNVEEFPTGLEGFSDIDGHWAENYIKLAFDLGYVNGYPDGTFRPTDPITRAEMATLLNNVLGRLVESEEDMLPGMKTWPDNPAGQWFYYAIQEATNSHFFNRKTADPSASPTSIIPEKWTERRDRPDWSLLEKPTANPEDLVY